jgi:hypothetical protein
MERMILILMNPIWVLLDYGKEEYCMKKLGDPGEKVIGTFEGEYDVPKGRREESMKVLLKNLKQ